MSPRLFDLHSQRGLFSAVVTLAGYSRTCSWLNFRLILIQRLIHSLSLFEQENNERTVICDMANALGFVKLNLILLYAKQLLRKSYLLMFCVLLFYSVKSNYEPAN